MTNEYAPRTLEDAKFSKPKPPERERLDGGFAEEPPHDEAEHLDPIAPSK